MKTGYFWTFYGGQDDRIFAFTPGRSSMVVEPWLKGYVWLKDCAWLKDRECVLLTVGYGEYDRFRKNTRPSPTSSAGLTVADTFFEELCD